MATETLSWAAQTTGTDQQLADFNGQSWTADAGGGTGTGSLVVTATLLDGSDVFAAQTTDGINGTNDASTINTGELVTVGNYADGGTANSALILRNIEGDGQSGAGATDTVSLQLDFTTNDTVNNSDGVDAVSFWINDIDTSSWDDQVSIMVFDTNGNLLPASTVSFSNVGSNVVVDNSGVPAVISSAGASISPTDASGAVQVTIDDPTVAVGRVVITYANLSTGGQIVEISDLTLITMPPPPPCFSAGTLIMTENGEVAVEDLVEGDLLVTDGNGLQPIRWIGHRTVKAKGDLAPICISKGALGNARDLLVSPAHRIVVSDSRIPLLFSEEEVLVPAKHLIDGDRIYRRAGGEVTYFHILLDNHEVIFADGVAAESLFLGRNNSELSNFSKEAIEEVLSVFPELNGKLPASGKVARPVLNPLEARLLAS